ncbi:16S rRNA (guanine(527)-N(7))-methyltransferase RsmG [Bifidobacterium tibiigranuli]|jgi:16S rRNA (guanine527-N7)-methyltransferase|uniref:16S rRNA (guanine(527)-N(7))-methyltransferase RsmG n=1 Tax=Bifidobacterium tibiigranuli TaxID=2172043 RepID=UPI0026EBCB9F|nr:16S rRNA (guanine(527)-N(7))-methyltransferase RsmG [Bifidobacterium tibiigranuli]MCI1649086.1 16S rRNA (guanine(527)-N(7))-methyltransferase RsmG [Bifidobacterium tibiigranuli]MCI2186321.1 16S rRNA (guanine(527)-N(7))-methyltransferase RsmG [Bifidobacterium tibiigranuli]MCI2203853.1 16S rRNA (guanine(527)-N(7))-methyltransferase RsmG [Bifidobacterium tibiigranuli]
MEYEVKTDSEIEESGIAQQVLGDAFAPCQMFHVKLSEEGELRGLIGPRDVDIIWERHILNSAAIVPFITQATAGQRYKTVADVGSGGGFPGLVTAACLPDHEFTLIEPMERRCEWLNECVALMGLHNVHVLRSRSEDIIVQMKKDRTIHPFAVVTCRAVAPMRKLSAWTLPLLKPQGQLIALKGKSAQEEIERGAASIAKAHGLHPYVVEAAVAPGLEPTHVVIVDKR